MKKYYARLGTLKVRTFTLRGAQRIAARGQKLGQQWHIGRSR